jgi:hypothetical protein
MAKLAALTRKAGATPTAAIRAPASGARAIWEMTAADHRPELAATSSPSSTMLGSTELAAGLKNTAPAASPNATAYTATRCWSTSGSTPARVMRHRSAATITRTRGSRSTTTPASGASSSTGAISATTTPDTPRPDPVSRNTSTTSATRLKVSPQRETVWAANRRR